MKIKAGDPSNPPKPGHTALVVPEVVHAPALVGARNGIDKDKAVTCLGSFHIVFGLVIMSTGIVSYIKSAGQYFMCLNTYYGMMFIVTGIVGIGAAKKKTRALIIAFMVLTIVSVFIALNPSGRSLVYLAKEHHKMSQYRGFCGTPDGPYPDWDDLMNDDIMDGNRTMRNNGTHMEDWKRHPVPVAMPSMMVMATMEPLEMCGNIVSIMFGIAEMIIAIASAILCCKAAQCCGCSKPQTRPTYVMHGQPQMVWPVNPASPSELSPKLLAEEAWAIKQTPPDQHLY